MKLIVNATCHAVLSLLALGTTNAFAAAPVEIGTVCSAQTVTANQNQVTTTIRFTLDPARLVFENLTGQTDDVLSQSGHSITRRGNKIICQKHLFDVPDHNGNSEEHVCELTLESNPLVEFKEQDRSKPLDPEVKLAMPESSECIMWVTVLNHDETDPAVIVQSAYKDRVRLRLGASIGQEWSQRANPEHQETLESSEYFASYKKVSAGAWRMRLFTKMDARFGVFVDPQGSMHGSEN